MFVGGKKTGRTREFTIIIITSKRRLDLSYNYNKCVQMAAAARSCVLMVCLRLVVVCLYPLNFLALLNVLTAMLNVLIWASMNNEGVN